MFDEKIFFYFEELDYFSRLNLTQNKVYLIPNILFSHAQGSSVDKNIVKDVYNLQQWHKMWSMYYVNKKVYNSLYALKIVMPYVVKDLLKISMYLFILRFDLVLHRFSRLSGAISSIVGKSSYKRPK